MKEGLLPRSLDRLTHSACCCLSRDHFPSLLSQSASQSLPRLCRRLLTRMRSGRQMVPPGGGRGRRRRRGREHYEVVCRDLRLLRFYCRKSRTPTAAPRPTFDCSIFARRRREEERRGEERGNAFPAGGPASAFSLSLSFFSCCLRTVRENKVN